MLVARQSSLNRAFGRQQKRPSPVYIYMLAYIYIYIYMLRSYYLVQVWPLEGLLSGPSLLKQMFVKKNKK